jgi:hypothetical protein
MLTGLTRYVYAPIAALALWAAILAVSPAVANAQATHQTQGQQEFVVVASDDSLWSISSKWLGPDATVRQIAGGVERIYALNRDRIGADPNLLLAGQRLVLPSAVERRAPEPGSNARERGADELTAAPSTTSQAANDGSGKATRAAVAEAHREPRHSAEARTEPASLPELIGATPIPAVRTLSPHDPSPSLAESFATEVGSSFSSVVAAVGEALPRAAVSGRKLLGGALLAMSAVLAIILALHVAREVRGPRYVRRRAQKPWVGQVRSRLYASPRAFDTRDAYGAASAATEEHPPDANPQKAAKLALERGLRPRAPSGHSANGGASSDTVRYIAASRQGKEAQMGSAPEDPHANQEWEISEPLRRSVEAIPLQRGASARDAFSEIKPLAEEALTTLAALERRRHLTDKEHRQAVALQRLLAALQEADREHLAG